MDEDLPPLAEPPLWPQNGDPMGHLRAPRAPAPVKENPKAAVGRQKSRQFFTPPSFRILVGAALELGAKKYGPFNWRKDPVRASDYLDPLLRHIESWSDGEDLDPESKIIHLAHAAACCAILIDAELCGTLIDDREKSGKVAELLNKIADRVKAP